MMSRIIVIALTLVAMSPCRLLAQSEAELKAGIMEMVSDFSRYMSKNFVDCRMVNSQGDSIGYFNSREPMRSTEDGVRTNIDMSMTCAFLYKYGRRDGVSLPEGITWDDIRKMAHLSLTFCLSSHVSNTLVTCSDRKYWGSIVGYGVQFESSLWAMTAAFAAYMLWDQLPDRQRQCVLRMLVTEGMSIVSRNAIPTRFDNDTKAEENGWDVGLLAAALGMFNSGHNAKFFDRMRRIAINTFSIADDKKDRSVIDPGRDAVAVADLYVGSNLYDDYTLQNHGYFHPGYQNVVIQELGEAYLALQLFGRDNGNAKAYATNALFHNCREVRDSVLNYLVLSDGDYAMPNGNDWSIFLFDQITTYATLACFMRDEDALMLEYKAFENIRARQKTTDDGSWLLNSDLGQRRMGVQAHRVVMTYLMHEVASTADMTPTKWQDFNRRYYKAKIFETQNIVRAASDYRTMIFSLCANGNRSGYFVPNNPDISKILLPYFNMSLCGNFVGYFKYDDKHSRGDLVKKPIFQIDDNTFLMNFRLMYYEGSMFRNVVFYCTEGNAVIYQDKAKYYGDATLQEDVCGLQCVSFDKFTKESRTISYSGGSRVIGAENKNEDFDSPWINIDNAIGIISRDEGRILHFGPVLNNSSVNCRLLSSVWHGQQKHNVGDPNESHAYVYLSGVNAEETSTCNSKTILLNKYLPDDWGGIITDDNTGVYVLVTNFFASKDTASLRNWKCQKDSFVPVIGDSMSIVDDNVSASFSLQRYTSTAFRANFFVMGNNIKIRRISAGSIAVTAIDDTKFYVAFARTKASGVMAKRRIKLGKGKELKLSFNGKGIVAEEQ